MASLVMVPRRSHERGQANHGWLQTSHTFSFGKYQDQKHQKYGPLRVINEDTIAPNHGFGEHTHHEYEIFTYVVDGELEHKDSMGNTEILSRGSIQLTSTGSGVSHSEQTHGSSPVHFLQIWAQPFNSSSSPSSSPLSISSRSPSPCRTSQHLHAPKYYTRHFTDAEKTNNFCRVVAPEWEHGISRDRSLKEGSKSGPAPIKSDLTMYASLVEKGHRVKRELSGRKAYLHVVQRRRGQEAGEKGAKVRVWGTHGFEELVLEEGDGVYVALIALRRGPGSDKGEIWVENVSEGEEVAEVLLFDME